MKKTWIAALILGAALAMGTTAFAEEAALKTIGTEAEGAYKVQIKNGTGRELSGFELRKIGTQEFDKKLMADGDVIAPDEEVILYFTPDADAAAAAQTEETAEAEGPKAPTPLYDARVTFKDDNSTAEIPNFPFEDMEGCEIKYEDGLVFIAYKSLTTGEELDTKEEARALIEAVLAAMKAAEEAAAAPAQSGGSSSGGGDYSYSEDHSYSDSGSSSGGGGSSYSEPAYEEPAYEEPAYEEPSGGGDSGGDPGCLDEGLVF